MLLQVRARDAGGGKFNRRLSGNILGLDVVNLMWGVADIIGSLGRFFSEIFEVG